MSEKIVTLNEEAIKGETRELVRGSLQGDVVGSLQGDVVGIIDTAGNLVVEFKRDAWGNRWIPPALWRILWVSAIRSIVVVIILSKARRNR